MFKSSNNDEPSIIEVDGKWYQEINRKLIEIVNPENEGNISSTEFSINDINIGNEFETLSGKFRITDIQGNIIVIEYLDGMYAGKTFQKNVNGLKEEVDRANKKKDISNKSKFINFRGDSGEAFTLGYLAAYGSIVARIAPNHLDSFKKEYNQLTGDNADNYLKEKRFLHVRTDDYPLDYFRIVFQASPELSQKLALHENTIVPLSYGDNNFQFNSRKFIFSLFRIGFRLGRNNNRVNEIAANIGKEQRKSFYEGVLFK